MDESAKDERTSTRLYGYSKINSKAFKKVVFVRGKRYTLLPALTKQGIIAVDIMEGSCTKQRFKEFVVFCYNPTYPLIVACAQITPQIAEGYFRGSGYF